MMKNTFVLMAITRNIVRKNIILMWIGISDRAMSKTYFRLSESVAVNTDMNINECLQPKLTSTIYFGPI